MHHKQRWLDFIQSRQAEVLPTRHIIFRDESSFNLSADDHCIRVGSSQVRGLIQHFFLSGIQLLHKVLYLVKEFDGALNFF